jgi:hypothetical protein
LVRPKLDEALARGRASAFSAPYVEKADR